MKPEDFLSSLDSTMAMKSGEWLEERLKNKEMPILLDLRGKKLWEEEHIEGSVCVSIQELPLLAESLITTKNSTVICICNGSIQSAMATMYLRTEDYSNTYNLSGGFSSWKKNNRTLIKNS
jgi:hydroxyacylglutathione hydrolase